MQNDSAIRIGILWYPSAQPAAVYGLTDLLGTAGRLFQVGDAKQRRIEPEILRASDSRLAPKAPRTPLAALILPPSLDAVTPLQSLHPLTAWIAARHRQGTLLCSVCAGAFLLAETGLLSGRPATTHWALGAQFAQRFPDVMLDTQKILIDDGDIITAGGMMAWMDLGLMLIARFLGPTAMLSSARGWVVDPRGREQRFYKTFAPVLTHGDSAILDVQHWLRAKCSEPINLALMARRAKLGQRTFLRRFERATQRTPTEYVQLLRVEKARDLLERFNHSFDEIAWRLGYQDSGAFRRVFIRVMGLTPGEYRKRFSVSAEFSKQSGVKVGKDTNVLRRKRRSHVPG